MNEQPIALVTGANRCILLINAVCPGWTAPYAGGEAQGARPVLDGAAGIVWAATLPDGGLTGGLFRDSRPGAW